MKIAVIGAGGVGGFIAAMLARAGEYVCVIARNSQKEVIERNGIVVQIGGKSLCAHPSKVTDDPSNLSETFDAVLFCTKGYDLESAAVSAKSIVDEHTILVPLGNGVANAQRVKRTYPGNEVANGAIYIVSHLKEPGCIEVKGKGAYMVIGTDSNIPSSVEKLAETLQKAGIKTKASGEITTEVWKKFLLISAMATLTSCYDEPMGAVLKEHGKELDRILREIMAVGVAEGAKLSIDDMKRVKEQIEKVPYDSPTSMWLDFRAGKKSELEELSGYVVKKGAEHNIAVPLMQKCYEELKSR